jgi:cytochrome c553
MRKLFLVLLCLAVFVTLAAAQNWTAGTSTINGVDVLGAHNNYGRGCAGCHAPHNGGHGNGGNVGPNAGSVPTGEYGTGSEYAPNTDPYAGVDALFGQDLSTLYGVTLRMGDNGRFSETLPLASLSPDEEITQIAMCLACHDGNIAKGGMMKGVSYEQSMGLLPANVYGVLPIPTLLGTNSLIGYNSTHPVGTNATLGRVHLVSGNTMNSCNLAKDLLCWTWNTVNSPPTPQSVAAVGYYANFVTNYGYPAIAGSSHGFGVAVPPSDTTGDPTKLYITCTTCHNQHNMYVYAEPGVQTGAKIYKGIYPTYFFINSPYNPNQPALTPQQAPSTTQFCRQCHSGESNEAAGVNNVTTSF